jgi:phage terminase large subunit-like protein
MKMALRINLYKPHAGQKPMHKSDARFRIASCGRRFGKTYMAVNEIVKFANENKNVNTIWCSPTYRQSKLAFDIILKNFKGAFKSHTKNPMQFNWYNGSVTKFNSTESGDTLRGDSVHMLVIDEASMVDEEVWTNVLRPMLSDTDGKAIIISTPKGINSWFHTLFTRGQDPEFSDYESFKFPTSANPYIPPTEIEEVRNTLPSDVFKQEYLAEFLEDGGQVFRNVMSCVKETLEGPTSGRSYTCAWDIAKHSDFSVVVVMENATGRVVALDRFNRIDYSQQVERVEAIARKYNNAHIILDSTGVGDPILEAVQKTGLSVEGYQFTNTSKQQLIEHLAVLIEKQEISYPNDKVLINELMSYQYEITRAGNMRYNAPSGMHDDCVIAMALAAWGAKHGSIPRIIRF